MKRFFFAEDVKNGPEVILDRDESHHLARVMRLKVGDEVELINGTGALLSGRVESLGQQAVIRVIRDITPDTAGLHPLWVCQGDLKSRKMDELIQRCTELGVQRFVPFHSSRSQGRLDERRLQRRLERWQATVKAACKQSGRLTLMDVDRDHPLEFLLAKEVPHTAVKILLWEEERRVRLADLVVDNPAEPVCLMFGPEGGFSRAEVELALHHGWHIASLGELVLRAETATLAAVAITQNLLGNI
jgi:16S rRNA (uracil1498-N3)-methyltransferase